MEFNIVTYLRNIGIEPEVTSKSQSDEPRIDKYHAIAYDKDLSYRFNTWYDTPDQWWKINFTKVFYLSSYKLIAGSYCNYVNNWKLEISVDDTIWLMVHSFDDWSKNQTIKLKQYHYAQYARITGRANGCREAANRLSFQRIYFYGIVNLNTCNIKKHNIHFLIFTFILC